MFCNCVILGNIHYSLMEGKWKLQGKEGVATAIFKRKVWHYIGISRRMGGVRYTFFGGGKYFL